MPPKKKRPVPENEYRKGGGGRNPQQNRKPKGKGGKRGNEPTMKEMRDIAADYGWAMSVFEQIPQLNDVFKEAIKQSWSPQRFIAEIQDKPWFKKHSDAWRQATYLQITDPATYKKRVYEITLQIQDAAGSLGIEPGRGQIAEWAEQAFKFGWDQARINNLLANSVKITGESTVGGSLAQTKDRLEGFAFANGVHVNQGTMQTWLRQIVRGNSTVEEYEQYINKMAVAKFPNWKGEIEAGMTVAEIADPFRQTMAQMLELNPATISLNSKLLQTALSNRNEKGEYQSMTLSDFEDMVRQDARWQYTDNARETVAGITASLLQSFGEIA